MYLYKKKLIEEGFTEGNAERLAKALDVLHGAIAKMDKEQLDLFISSTSIHHRLEDFAKIEELYVFRIN